MVRTLVAGSQAASVALSCTGFVIGILVTVFVFMPDTASKSLEQIERERGAEPVASTEVA